MRRFIFFHTMYKPNYNQRKAIRFRHFSRKGYALFACVGRVVTIGILSVATLQSASAAEVSAKESDTATTDSIPTTKEAQLDDVEVTGSRAPLANGQAARMVTVLSRDEIQAAPVQSINDLLKYAVGVDVRQRGPIGAQTDIGIRGGTQEQIAILLNGINICDPQTGHNAFDFPVDISEIERIEVLEGPAGRVYGTSSLAGAINIVTKREKQSCADVHAEGGSFGYLTAGGRLVLRPDNSPLTSSLSASMTRSDGYSRSKAGSLNSDYQGGKVFYQGRYDCDLLNLNWHAGLSSKGFGSNTFYSAKFDNQYERTTKFFTALQGETRCGILNFRPSVYWNRSQDRFELIRGSEEAVPYNYHRTDVFGLSLNSWFDSPLGRTAFGAEFRNEDIISGNLGEPLNTPVHIHGTERDYKYGLNRSNLSFHLEHNILLRQFTLSAGFVAFKNTWNEMPFTLYPGVDASVRLGDHWKIYASYNSSLRMPSFTELYYSVGGHKADKYLKPEELRALEGGVKFYSAALLVQASIYHHHSRNLIDWVLDPTAEEPVWQSVNFTKVNTIGTEISARLDLEHLFRLPQSYLSVAYSYNDQDKADEHQLESQSKLEYLRHKLVGTLQLTPINHWSFLVNYRMQKRTGTYLTVDGVTKPYHTYDLVDARLTWSQPTYSIYAQANNIFSRNYVDYGNVEQPGAWIVVGARLHINL